MRFRTVLFGTVLLLVVAVGFNHVMVERSNPLTTIMSNDVIPVMEEPQMQLPTPIGESPTERFARLANETPTERFARLVDEASRRLPTDNNLVEVVRFNMRRGNLTPEEIGTSEAELNMLAAEGWLRGAAQLIHEMRNGRRFTDNTVELTLSKLRMAKFEPEHISSSREELAGFMREAMRFQGMQNVQSLRRK